MDLRTWIAARQRGEKIPLTLAPNEQNLYGLTLADAINAHEAWCQKLELTLRGQNPEEYDADILSADHLCALGKWLYGEGKVLQAFSEYEELKKDHQVFHKCAGNILTNHKKGHFADAIHSLRHELIDLSKKVEVDLVQLLVKVQEEQKAGRIQ